MYQEDNGGPLMNNLARLGERNRNWEVFGDFDGHGSLVSGTDDGAT